MPKKTNKSKQKPWDFNTGKKSKTLTEAEQERIYIIVPEQVTVPDKSSRLKGATKTLKMVPGRLMAQCSHVGRELEHVAFWDLDEARKITTIVLAARNTKEMIKLQTALKEQFFSDVSYVDGGGIGTDKFAEFYDTNEQLYGKGVEVLTAIAVGPVLKRDVDDIIGHLALYGEE